MKSNRVCVRWRRGELRELWVSGYSALDFQSLILSLIPSGS